MTLTPLKMLIRVLIYLGIISAGILVYVRYVLAVGVFFPTKELEASPAQVNLKFKEVNLITEDNLTIHSWFIANPQAYHTILFFHGNGGNISHRLDKIKLLYDLGLNVFIIDYHGYGQSQGIPSEKAIYMDAQAAYNYLVTQTGINSEEIILYGESLGGAVAIDLASREKVAGLIIEGCFSSGKDIARHLYPFVPSLFFPRIFNSLEKIKKIKAPVLAIHSKVDEIVPFALGKKLYEAAPNKSSMLITQGGHNDAVYDLKKEYRAAIVSFIKNIGN